MDGCPRICEDRIRLINDLVRLAGLGVIGVSRLLVLAARRTFPLPPTAAGGWLFSRIRRNAASVVRVGGYCACYLQPIAFELSPSLIGVQVNRTIKSCVVVVAAALAVSDRVGACQRRSRCLVNEGSKQGSGVPGIFE